MTNGYSDFYPNKIQKNLITDFWSNFGGKKNKGSGFEKDYKLKKLKEMANVKIDFKKCQPLYKKRTIFNEVKYKRHSLINHSKCFVCNGEAEVRHHIISLKNGGINSKKNIVSLCKKCHKLIHPWM